MTDTMYARGAIASILERFPDLDADDLNTLHDAYLDIGQGIDADNVLGSPWTVFDGVLRTRAGLVAWAKAMARTLRSFPIPLESRRAYDDVIHALHFGLWRHAEAAGAGVAEPDAFLDELLETLAHSAFVNDQSSPQPSSDALGWLLTRSLWTPTPTVVYSFRFNEDDSSITWNDHGGAVRDLKYLPDPSGFYTYGDDVLSLIRDLGL